MDVAHWLTLLFCFTTALFLWMTSSAIFHLQWVHRLPGLSDRDVPPGAGKASEAAVRCSVVIAARDEESRIENSIRNLLAQREVNLVQARKGSTARKGSRNRNNDLWHRGRMGSSARVSYEGGRKITRFRTSAMSAQYPISSMSSIISPILGPN